MEKKDVPQDQGILGHVRVVCYATDENGEYTKSESAGWEPTNIAKELSPLAYHMNKNLMDLKVLSQYIGFAKWRVRRHLKPRAFNDLDNETLQRYAAIFNMTVEQLKEVP
jgi:hypothetical protein